MRLAQKMHKLHNFSPVVNVTDYWRQKYDKKLDVIECHYEYNSKCYRV